ncbi:methionyl-tRNA formyltransferase [Bacillus sp. UNCCL81]|uniref:methionyl-tRNA formyltransferase n=1 Tax=Bacillus sp. UNCCL81 TaxID=1502755 RepID=UPI0008F10594|nr:methionyl-tRNA formyltransferase [Bacillus sp. UNCCL81]SFC76898.1 methionyl-tRNA formyltransferase [Bacillus sp. UNCCL81]
MTKIVFMGTPDFSVPVLRRLIDEGYDVVGVVTQPDRPVGRKRVLTPPPVKVEALKHNIPVLQPEKIRLPEETEKVLALKPDLIVTAAFGQILPTDILEAPKFGCINVHASLLPELRGGAPIHYSIIQGKSETGVTIMYMVEKLDAGDMLAKVVVPIEEKDHVGTLHDKLSIAGANLLSETIPPLLKGEMNAVKQDESKVSFAKNIKREEEQINWSKTGEEIYNHVRGLHPWPVAYTTLNGEVLKVWWGEKVNTNQNLTPGEIIDVLNDGILVATGNHTAIKITDIQPAGKKRMEAKQYINGAGSFIERGMKLGE